MARKRWSFWMSPLEHGFIRALDDRFRAWFTPMGQTLLVCTLACSFLLLGGLSPLLVQATAFCGAALLAALFTGIPSRPRLRMERRIPPFPSAGDEWGYDAIVENLGSKPARDVWLQERALPAEVRPVGDPTRIPFIAPGERAIVRLRVRCSLRGEYRLPRLEASTSAPSGLLRLDCGASPPSRLLVYPAFQRLESFDVPVGRTHQPGGVPVASKLGDSTEFAGLRDWREGDRPRDVHWPSFARSGRLVVREFHEEYFARLALVVDVEARTAEEEKTLERALSITAAIADALARQEYLIDLFVAGDKVHHMLAGRALAHFENVLELLACVEPGVKVDAAALEAAIVPAAARLSAVILVITNWSPERRALLERLRGLGPAIRVVCARPGLLCPELDPDERVEVA